MGSLRLEGAARGGGGAGSRGATAGWWWATGAARVLLGKRLRAQHAHETEKHETAAFLSPVVSFVSSLFRALVFCVLCFRFVFQHLLSCIFLYVCTRKIFLFVFRVWDSWRCLAFTPCLISVVVELRRRPSRRVRRHEGKGRSPPRPRRMRFSRAVGMPEGPKMQCAMCIQYTDEILLR